jgi:hydroxyethylthiazole kinase-like uncharacterized protein yjeF
MREITPERLNRELPLPSLDGDGDKEKRGRVLAVGGGAEVPGAILLAGLASLRAGAGKLVIGTVEPAALELGLAVPEARIIGLPQTMNGEIALAASRLLAESLSRTDAMVAGPGMLDEKLACRLVERLAQLGGDAGFVLDAGAMTALLERAEKLKGSGRKIVITPHAGEMASLLGCDKSRVEAAPVETAREAAEALGAVVALKGPTTHVVTPEGDCWLHEGGAVGLGTSGSGDVLAGAIGGLMARGASAVTAACWGVWLHGAAGRALSERVGPLGFLAREILDEIPRAMAAASPA